MIDITKVPKNLKDLLINLILVPFWILSIYIFHPELYKSNDYIIIGSLCICLILTSSILNSYALLKAVNMNQETTIVMNVLIQIVIFSSLFLLSYLSGKIFNLKFEFYGFVLTYFLILLSFTILIILRKRNLPK